MTAQRRVALVLGSSTGGIAQHVGLLASALTERGLVVRVVGPSQTLARLAAAASVERVAVEIPAGPALADLVAVRRLRSALAGCDLVHAHGLRAGLLCTFARRPRPVPLVVTWHNRVLGSPLRRWLHTPLERRVARGADRTLGASADLAERARALGARNARLVPVAPPDPPASDSARALRSELGTAGRPLVVAVARLHPQKRLDVLVDASLRWRERSPQPVTVIAGEGPLRVELERRIAADNAPVRLLGHRADAPALLATADVVVLPSAWEARALVAQEAMRAGRPLVTTPVGGLPELVGDAAVLVPVGDAAALADAVTALLDDPGRARRLGQRARERALTWPTAADTVETVVGVYSELWS